MRHEAVDVAVVGAGIVGAACARECALRGLRVVVVEPSIVGGGATAAGMGHIVVLDDSEAQRILDRYSQTLWDDLAGRLPASCELQRSGTLWVAADDEEMAEAERKRRLYAEHGIEAALLDARALAREEPSLRAGLPGGLLVPGDSVVYPPVAARFLLEEALSLGAELRLGTPAALVDESWVRLADGSAIRSRHVVNAAGSRAPDLSPGIPIRPRKGHLAITDRYPGFATRQLIELSYVKRAHAAAGESVACNVQPRPTGQLLVGSSRQFDATDRDVEPRILGRMLARAIEYLPGLAELTVIRTWTGFRAATPDGLPLIGPCADVPGLLLATGHEGLGITTCLATAKLIAASILEESPPIPAAPYLPSRFTTDG